ncbi:hypothetical protein [Vibrio superstes]|nr:hypothetical protein [Vibrio superstes]
MLEKGELDFAIRMYNNRTLPEGYHTVHLDDVKLLAVTSSLNLDKEARDLPIFFFDGLDEVILSTHFEHSQKVPDATTALSILRVKPGVAIIPESMHEQGEHQPIAINGANHLLIRRVLLWYQNLQLNPEKRFIISNLMSLLQSN